MNIGCRIRSLSSLALIACSSEEARDPDVEIAPSELTGVIGMNCAGADPVMEGPDGQAYVFQDIVGYYYDHALDGAWTRTAGEPVLQLWVPPAIEAVSEAFYAWQAKSAQIYRARDALAHAHRYYRGVFGALDEVDVETDGLCAMGALDPAARRLGRRAHFALSQAGECGVNDDGTTKFWQVNGIVLLPLGEAVDAYELVSAGAAIAVAHAPPERCILPSMLGETIPPPGEVPCAVAWRGGTILEALVLDLSSSATVAGVSLESRSFTAAGTEPLSSSVGQVRTILRAPQSRAMAGVGLPTAMPAPEAGPSHVRIVAQAVGPVASPSSALRLEERMQVDMMVGTYAAACCQQVCTPAEPGPGSGSGSGSEPEPEPEPGPGSGSGSPPEPEPQPGPGSGSGATAVPALDPAGFVADNGGGATCETVCIPEGQCQTAMISDGLAVVLTQLTTAECNGSCPEPATGAPVEQPTCRP